jgi:hypothetical protein
MATRLDNTLSALKGGITALAADKAVKNIEGWEKALSEADKPELEPIVKDLGKLKKMLQGSELDGPAIGKLLTKLGKATAKAAGDAPQTSSKKLQNLAEMLSSSGKELG